jgi:hypothetical protein
MREFYLSESKSTIYHILTNTTYRYGSRYSSSFSRFSTPLGSMGDIFAIKRHSTRVPDSALLLLGLRDD